MTKRKTHKSPAYERMKKRQWVLMVADHCQGLAEGWVEPELRDEGLCGQFSEYFDLFSINDLCERFETVFKQWPLFSGNSHFPVPGPVPDACLAYVRASRSWYGDGDLWDDTTEYGQNRLDLCEWVADWLRENVEELAG